MSKTTAESCIRHGPGPRLPSANSREEHQVTVEALVCRALLGIVFAASAFAKLRNRQAFESFVSWLAGLPWVSSGARPVAVMMTATEGLVVVLVALPSTWSAGLTLAAAALTVFAAGTFAVTRSGPRTPCHCFGPSQIPLGRRHGVRNVLLCAAALGAGGRGPVPDAPAGIVLCLDAGAALALVVLFFDELAAFLVSSGPAPAAPRHGPTARIGGTS